MARAPDPEQDLQWVQAVQRHDDREAFASLVRAHQGAVRALMRRWCHGDVAVADELAQETFLTAWQSLRQFRAEARFRTWLYRVAYTTFLQQARRGAERVRRLERAEADSGHSGGDPAAGTEGTSADHAAVASQGGSVLSEQVALGLDLQRALEALTAPQREAIALCHLSDLSHAEAAEVLGWPIGTVKTHVLRGKAGLRQSLAAWAPVAGTPGPGQIDPTPAPVAPAAAQTPRRVATWRDSDEDTAHGVASDPPTIQAHRAALRGFS